jgi:hypothetical protein
MTAFVRFYHACIGVCALLIAASPALRLDDDVEGLRKLLQSDEYSVIWSPAPNYDAAADLEIGYGAGHGAALSWMRFQPRPGYVNVLSIKLAEDRGPLHQYWSKWPPDHASVTIKQAWMKPDRYQQLLREIAILGAARLTPIEHPGWSRMSSGDIWIYARLMSGGTTRLDLEWAGYMGSDGVMNYAKPRAITNLAEEAVQKLRFEQHPLTKEERSWASQKFSRDWKKFKNLDFHWWVRERYIVMIGVVGDATALPTLLGILKGDGARWGTAEKSRDRCLYLTINAITRLTGGSAPKARGGNGSRTNETEDSRLD